MSTDECQGVKSGESQMTSDLSSALEVCIDDDVLHKSTYTSLGKASSGRSPSLQVSFTLLQLK